MTKRFNPDNVIQLLALSEVAWIDHIHDTVTDRKEGEPEFSRWYVVHVELPVQDSIQTLEFTVTDGCLEEVLTAMGWTVEPEDIRKVVQ